MENLGPLILANSGLDSLKTILAIRRASHPGFSYSYISKTIGIRSRSYLSEALSGKKPLHAEHIAPIVDLLDLPPDESSLLKNKLLREMGDLHLDTILTLCVALRLFEGNCASRQEILDLFPRARRMDIDKGINDLLQLGFVLQDEGDDILHLDGPRTLSAEVNAIRHSLKEAMERAHDDDMDSETSIFYSSIVATDMAEFQAALESIKQNVRGIQSQMLSPGKGDSLIRFNMQLYPIVQKKRD